MEQNLIHRPRRLRRSKAIRELVRETRISSDSLIMPYFIKEGSGIVSEISSLPGIYHYSPDRLIEGVGTAVESGIKTILLFGIPRVKDEIGTSAWLADGVVQAGIKEVKKHYPQLTVITDVCLCEYTDHGHCGVLKNGQVDNDETLPLLAKTAISHINAGADIVAPSDMMDGRVGAIRKALDKSGYNDTPIMSYSVKYASGFYGPFREAAGSTPGQGDRKGYQMDFHNSREALKELELDEAEGADIHIVKPALSYLDVISRVSAVTNLPVAAYSVSGEYAMIKASGAAGLIDEYTVMCESAVSIYRAGADILISYFSPELAQAIKRGDIG